MSYPLELVDYKSTVCGKCQACCECVAVEEIDKRMYSRCPKQDDSGCSIYASRPEPCRKYYCLYQAGIIVGEENRPDKLGVLFDYRDLEYTTRQATVREPCVMVWEVWPGAADKPEVNQLVRLLLHRIPSIRLLVRPYASEYARIVSVNKDSSK